MGWLGEYRVSLKPSAVEEPIDRWVHRPLAFLVAKAAAKASLTPNQLTVFSMLLGVTTGVLLLVGATSVGATSVGTRALMIAAALTLFASQVVDCSDGMLARMRGGGSEIGRMLDGCADTVTLLFASVGTICHLVARGPRDGLALVALLGALGVTLYTSSLHTSAYDHYKNLFLRGTIPGDHEGEDVESAQLRWDRVRAQGRGGRGATVLEDVLFRIYVGYLRAQRRLIAWYDPDALVRLSELPAGSPAARVVFAQSMQPTLVWWRSLFGVGSLVFTFSLALALDQLVLFVAFRLVVLNAIFFLVLLPAQRSASRRAMAALGVQPRPPEDRARLLHA
jgi:phosphatidylglycerophosphate synthase